jgi:hypothetical protein
MADGGFIIEGEDRIERARWLTVRMALKLEMHGLPRSRGPSARQLANEITGEDHKTRKAAYKALNKKIVDEIGPEFDRPIP